jgi:putative transposase
MVRLAGPQPLDGPRPIGTSSQVHDPRPRGSNFTTAFDAVLADAGIRTVLCSVRTPRMNAMSERRIGGWRRELMDRTLAGTKPTCGGSCASTKLNHHRTHRSLHAAAPLQPLPEPVNHEQYHIRRQTRVGGLGSEIWPDRMT